MSVLTVIQNACLVLGLDQPDTVYGSTARENQELGRTANQVSDAIFRTHDWQSLKEIEVITGDNETEDFDLPTDYARMLKKSNVWSSSLSTSLVAYPDSDVWLELDVQAFDFVINAWTIFGDQIHIKPALGDGVTAQYFYMRNTKVSSSGGTPKTSFTADDDNFAIGKDTTAFERLLQLGVIYQWKQNKGFPYAEFMTDFEVLKSTLMTPDKGSRSVKLGRVRYPYNARLAYPQNITPTS